MEKALSCFEGVLNEDPENLNAWGNSRFIYEKLKDQESIENCEAKLNDLITDAKPGREVNLRLARCFAEQAYVIQSKVGIEDIEERGGTDMDRYLEANSYLEKAFDLDRKCFGIFSKEERCHWLYMWGYLYHLLYGQYYRDGKNYEVCSQVFNKAVDCLTEVIKKASSENYVAKAWCLMGTFFWKHNGGSHTMKDTPAIISEYDLTEEFQNPGICFIKACTQLPKDPKILPPYSRYLMRIEEYQQAIDMLTKSIEMDKSEKNWFAFSSRSLVYKNLYLAQQRHDKRGQEKGRGRWGERGRGTGRGHGYAHESQQTPPSNVALLEKAIDDIKASVKLRPNLQDTMRLGQLYHFLGNHKKDVRVLINQAMEQFEYVLCRLDGKKNQEMHKGMGYCLRDISRSEKGEYTRKAIEAFKRAVECDWNEGFPQNFYQMILLLLQMSKEQNNPQHLIEEIGFWFTEAFEKYTSVELPVQKCCEYHTGIMVKVCKVMVSRKHYDVAAFFLKELQGVPKANHEEVASLLRKCTVHPVADSLSDCRISTSVTTACKLPPHSYPHIQPGPVNTCNKLDKIFDFLVLNGSTGRDAAWVYYSMIPRLEGCHKFKACLPTRDLDPGVVLSDQVVQVIDKVVCTIVVLTPRFCEDETKQSLLERYFGGDDGGLPVIAIMLEECSVPRSLRHLKVRGCTSWELIVRDLQDMCQR